MKRTRVMATAIVAAVALPGAALAAGWSLSLAAGSAGGSKAPSIPSGPTPTAPTTSSQSTASITVTWPTVNYVGTSTPVAAYTVARYKGGALDTIAGTCTGTQNGTSCTDTVTTSGSYQYAITAKNNNWTGAEGAKSGTVTVTLSSVATPSTPDLLAADDSGASNSDDITSVTKPHFTGTGGTPGNTISLFFDGSTTTVNGTGIVAADGTWSVAPTSALSGGPAAGGASHTVKAQESVGATKSSMSSALSFTVDTVKPAAANVVNSNKTTGGTQGLAEVGDTVTLTFSEAIDPASIVSGWDGTSRNVVVHVTKSSGNNDRLTVFDSTDVNQLPIGVDDLGGIGYVSASVTFGATGTPSTMTVSSAGVVTIQLGTVSSSSNVTTNTNPNRASWTPTTTVTDVAGNACDGVLKNPNSNVRQF